MYGDKIGKKLGKVKAVTAGLSVSVMREEKRWGYGEEGRMKAERAWFPTPFDSLGQSERAFKPYPHREMTISSFITETGRLPPWLIVRDCRNVGQ